MSVTIRIPSALRAYVAGETIVETEGHTVAEALASLERAYPAISKHLRDESGNLRGFVNVFKGEENIRHLDGERSVVAPGDELTIVPAIAGGKG